MKMILISGCYGEGKGKIGPKCPYLRIYSDEKGNPVDGCSSCYGPLPTTGHPDWCPLPNYGKI